ncbi:hypothetical protein ACQ86D_26445 [Streptomyces galilaeus]
MSGQHTGGALCQERRNDGAPCRNSPIRGTRACRVHAGPAQLEDAAKKALALAHKRLAAAAQVADRF